MAAAQTCSYTCGCNHFCFTRPGEFDSITWSAARSQSTKFSGLSPDWWQVIPVLLLEAFDWFQSPLLTLFKQFIYKMRISSSSHLTYILNKPGLSQNTLLNMRFFFTLNCLKNKGVISVMSIKQCRIQICLSSDADPRSAILSVVTISCTSSASWLYTLHHLHQFNLQIRAREKALIVDFI